MDLFLLEVMVVVIKNVTFMVIVVVVASMQAILIGGELMASTKFV